MPEFLIKVVLTAVVTLLIKGGFAVFGASIHWILAALIALVIVFGGWFIVVHSDDWSWD